MGLNLLLFAWNKFHQLLRLSGIISVILGILTTGTSWFCIVPVEFLSGQRLDNLQICIMLSLEGIYCDHFCSMLSFWRWGPWVEGETNELLGVPKPAGGRLGLELWFAIGEASVRFPALCCLSQMSYGFMHSIQNSESTCSHLYIEGFQIISLKLKLV